jgi:hypothetical protein
MIRTTKILLVALVSLWGVFGALGNLLKLDVAYQLVLATMRMPGFEPGSAPPWATESPLIAGLGVALIVIGTLHTGFQLGWNVHTLAYALMMVVILSGIYGVAVYATLPASLSNNSKEMTRGQILPEVGVVYIELFRAEHSVMFTF